MIVNFYLNTRLLAKKNIGIVPNCNDYVSMSGQVFYVITKELDLNEQYEQYNVYLKRCKRP
jgi:hypothetical protein